MAGLWEWFKGRRRANGKLVVGELGAGKPLAAGDPDAPIASRKTEHRSTEAAIDKATDDWEKNGDRVDQDYYHVAGAGNPDLKDPPTLDGDPMPKPRKGARAQPRPR